MFISLYKISYMKKLKKGFEHGLINIELKR